MTNTENPPTWPIQQPGVAWIPAPPPVSDPLIWRATKQAALAIRAALNWRDQANHPSYAELARRRAIPITPIYCQHPHCHTSVSVPHPLPEDLQATRCAFHRNQAGTA